MAADSTPPNTPKPAFGIGSLTPRECELLTKAWSCLKSGAPEVDYSKLAAEVGMTNPRSAQNAWGVIKKKMQWGSFSGGETSASASKATGTPASNKRKKTGTPAKNKALDDDHDELGVDDDAGDQDATPSKKSKTTGDGETPRKKQGSGRKPKTPAKVVKEEEPDTEMKDSGDDQKVVKAEADVKKESGDEADNGTVAQEQHIDAV